MSPCEGAELVAAVGSRLRELLRRNPDHYRAAMVLAKLETTGTIEFSTVAWVEREIAQEIALENDR